MDSRLMIQYNRHANHLVCTQFRKLLMRNICFDYEFHGSKRAIEKNSNES